jgi:2-polyprenyl-6-methoxyphenol hydroxylase-like FAD-dependent oxidoreductase
MARHAVISGGSIGGLFAAAALLRAGWSVDVYERSEVELSGRGAGIVIHDRLIDAFRAVGADLNDLGVRVQDRVAYAKDGRAVATLPFPQVVTSWDRIHQILRRLIPTGHYHLGRHIVGYKNNGARVTAHFADGAAVDCDLLVGADGFRSAIRAQMLPDVVPQYSGYVVWRALAQEGNLPPAIRKDIFPNFAFFAPSGSQIIGYPIAGLGNDLRPGHRRYNFVWYKPVEAETLRHMLTDDSGQHHAVSIPPPLVRDGVIDDLRMAAMAQLPAPFVDILTHSERPFFTPIYDHHSPVMHDGRVALAGDAACVARPHVGMGVTKAADDALALATYAEGDLAGYSAARVGSSLRAHLQARHLASLMLAPDPVNQDGAHNKHLEEIMRLTATTVD